MDKLVSIILLCSIILATFSGCYDAREVDDEARVLVLGIDKGVSNKWRITLQFSTIKESSGGGSGGGGMSNGGGKGDFTYVTLDTPSFFEGVNILNSSISRKLIFTHTRVIVISEELAKEGTIGEFMAPLIRNNQIRGSTHLIVSKGSALDLIKANEPFIGTSLSKALETIAKESSDTGYFGHTTLNDFYNDLKSSYRQPIMTMAAVNEFKNFKEKGPIWKGGFKDGGEYLAGQLPRQGQNKIEYWGTAIFKKDKMVAELNGSQNRTLLMIRGGFRSGFFTIQDPKKPDLIIALDIRQDKKPKVKIDFEGDIPTIDLTVHLEGIILALQSRFHYEEDPLLSLLEEAFKEDIKHQIDQLINKCKDLNVDVFRFGDKASRQFKTIDEWEKYNWNKRFKDAKVTTQVEFVIKRTGTRVKSSPIPSPEGEE